MTDIPDLIEPIPVEIQPLDKANTPASTGVAGRREFSGTRKRKTTVILQAQVVFGDRDIKTKFTQLGPDEQIKGYILVRFKDLKDKGLVLKRGDKITKLGQLNVELFLTHGQGDPAAHFTSIGSGGEFTLVRAPFGDRNPVG